MFRKTIALLLSLSLVLTLLPQNRVNAMTSSPISSEENYIDELGRKNKVITYIDQEIVKVSIYINGVLEQESTVDLKTGNITGFMDYGEKEINENVSDTISVETSSPKSSLGNIEITPFGTGYYSQVASKATTAVGSCKATTAYLFEKTGTVTKTRHVLKLTSGQAISAVLGTIIASIALKTPMTSTMLRAALVGTGASVVGSVIQSGFEGSYYAYTTTKDYYATINNTRYFTNKITSEYFVLYNQYTGKSSTERISQTVTAYGSPTSYQVMLSQAIATFGRGC